MTPERRSVLTWLKRLVLGHLQTVADDPAGPFAPDPDTGRPGGVVRYAWRAEDGVQIHGGQVRSTESQPVASGRARAPRDVEVELQLYVVVHLRGRDVEAVELIADDVGDIVEAVLTQRPVTWLPPASSGRQIQDIEVAARDLESSTDDDGASAVVELTIRTSVRVT